MAIKIAELLLMARLMLAAGQTSKITGLQYSSISKEVSEGLNPMAEFEAVVSEWKEAVLDEHKGVMEESLKILKDVEISKDTKLHDYEALIKDGVASFVESRDVLHHSLCHGTKRFVEFIHKLYPFWHIMFSTDEIWSTAEPRLAEDKDKFGRVNGSRANIKKYIGEISKIIKEMSQMVEAERTSNLILSKLNLIPSQFTEGNAAEVKKSIDALNIDIPKYNAEYYKYLKAKIALFNECERFFRENGVMGTGAVSNADIQNKLNSHGLAMDARMPSDYKRINGHLIRMYGRITFNTKFSSCPDPSKNPSMNNDGSSAVVHTSDFYTICYMEATENSKLLESKPPTNYRRKRNFIARKKRLIAIRDAAIRGQSIPDAKRAVQIEILKEEEAENRRKEEAIKAAKQLLEGKGKEKPGALRNSHLSWIPLIIALIL